MTQVATLISIGLVVEVLFVIDVMVQRSREKANR